MKLKCFDSMGAAICFCSNHYWDVVYCSEDNHFWCGIIFEAPVSGNTYVSLKYAECHSVFGTSEFYSEANAFYNSLNKEFNDA